MHNKNKKVFLLVPNTVHAITSNNYIPTLGVCYISGFLTLNNIKVEMLDNYLERLNDLDLLKRLNKDNCLILGVYVPSRSMLFSFLSFIYKYHEQLDDSIKIILGGPFAALAYNHILAQFRLVDFIAIGFGENTILELYNCLINKNDYKKIKNLAFFNESTGKIICKKQHDILPQNLPIPDLKYYFKTFGNKLSYTISCSRGCLGKCTFCIVNMFYNSTQGKPSIYHIMEQVSNLKNNGVNAFTFIDDNFFNSIIFEKDNFTKLYNFLIKMDVRFSISARIVDILEYKEEIIFLKKMGMASIFVGVESFYNDTLSLFNKNLNVNQIYKMFDFLEENNIIVFYGFIFFHPWSSIEEVKENILHIKNVYNSYSRVICEAPIQDLEIIYKTPLYYKAKKESLLEGDIFSGFSFKFKCPIVNKIHIKWIEVNNELLTNYKGDKKKLVLIQVQQLEKIIEEVTNDEKTQFY